MILQLKGKLVALLESQYVKDGTTKQGLSIVIQQREKRSETEYRDNIEKISTDIVNKAEYEKKIGQEINITVNQRTYNGRTYLTT